MEGEGDRKARGNVPQNSHSFAQLSAYLSVGFLTFMYLIHANKTLITKQKQAVTNPGELQANYIYDPDHGLNMSHVCLTAENVHKTKYKDSPCMNKTFIGWYNPWARHHSWKKLWREKDEKRRERMRQMEEKKGAGAELDGMKSKMEPEKVETVEAAKKPEDGPPPPTKKNEEPKKLTDEEIAAKKKQKQLEMLYAILIGLLLMSVCAACWEAFKERLTGNRVDDIRAQAERECALANFTINRHLRRESQQQASSSLPKQSSLEQRSKVTQTFTHQSSLDRALPVTSSEALNPRTDRRYSVPAGLPGDGIAVNRAANLSPQLVRVKRLSSIDIAPEDVHSDSRKKPRHFIRRH